MTPFTPQLLVSVRSPAEANIAVEGGADIIDIKEPSRGPLGMANVEVIASIIAVVGGRKPISVALGDVTDAMPQDVSGDVAFAKIGVPIDRDQNWRDLLAGRFVCVSAARSIVVIYADELARCNDAIAFIDDIMDWMIEHHAAGLLIDTRDKKAGDLFGCLSESQLGDVTESTREANKLIALAGKLTGESLRRAIELSPDIVGVRGAVCADGDRGQSIDADRLRQVRSLISESCGHRDQPAKAGAGG